MNDNDVMKACSRYTVTTPCKIYLEARDAKSQHLISREDPTDIRT